MHTLGRPTSVAVRLCSLLLCLVSPPGLHPQAATAADTTYTLHGTTLNGATGKPLARVLVVSNDHRLATLSDSEGHFTLTVRAQAQATDNGGQHFFGRNALNLQAQRPGYFFQPFSGTIQLDQPQASGEIQLKLMPEAVLSGTVSSEEADAAHGVSVMLLQHRVQDGTPIWTFRQNATTDLRGGFRFANLSPGEYTVMTGEWSGGRPLPLDPTAVHQEYPPVFCGDTPDLASATKLQVKFGDSPRADIHLHRSTYYPVTMPVAGVSPGVNVRITEPDGFGGYGLGYDGREHAVTGWLPTGSYTVLLSSYGPTPAFALLPLHVNAGPVRTGAVALTPARSIPVRVQSQLTRTETQGHLGVNVYLQPLDPGLNAAGGASQADKGPDLVLENVQPGHYLVHVQSYLGYVASLRSGGVDLLRDPLVIGSNGGADPIDLVLRDDAATVTGTVKTGDSALPERTYVVLLPIGSTQQMPQSMAGPDGKFTLANVAPGSYRLLAMRNFPFQIPYRDAEAMQAWDNKGVVVSVVAAQQLEADVPLLDEGDEPPSSEP